MKSHCSVGVEGLNETGVSGISWSDYDECPSFSRVKRCLSDSWLLTSVIHSSSLKWLSLICNDFLNWMVLYCYLVLFCKVFNVNRSAVRDSIIQNYNKYFKWIDFTFVFNSCFIHKPLRCTGSVKCHRKWISCPKFKTY